MLEFVVESCSNKYYQLFDLESQKVLDIIEKKNLLESLLQKILPQEQELSISSFQKSVWLNVLNNICYQGSFGILQKFKKQFHNYLDSKIEFEYENDKSHNLLKSAFQGMNMHLALWLVENYNFSFWYNFKSTNS